MHPAMTILVIVASILGCISLWSFVSLKAALN